MATLKEIARTAGVSIATVSNVVNGTKQATPAVTARVQAAIAQLGYTPNPHAQSLRTGHSRTLGLVVPDLTNPYFPALVQAIETTARALGYVLIVMDSGNDADREGAALALLANFRVAGVVWVPVDAQRPLHWPYPIVTVDRPIPGCDSVAADHTLGGKMIAEYARHNGHHTVGLLSGPQHLPSATLRRSGFLNALRDTDIAWEYEVPFSSELPEVVRKQLEAPQCSLVVCANDAVAVAVIRRARAIGLRIPNELSVVGFDDVPWADFVDPGLTTVRQPLAHLGTHAATLLHRRITDPQHPPQHQILPVEFVIRGSAILSPSGTT
jgi:LacI family transcriptional regulator